MHTISNCELIAVETRAVYGFGEHSTTPLGRAAMNIARTKAYLDAMINFPQAARDAIIALRQEYRCTNQRCPHVLVELEMPTTSFEWRKQGEVFMHGKAMAHWHLVVEFFIRCVFDPMQEFQEEEHPELEPVDDDSPQYGYFDDDLNWHRTRWGISEN